MGSLGSYAGQAACAGNCSFDCYEEEAAPGVFYCWFPTALVIVLGVLGALLAVLLGVLLGWAVVELGFCLSDRKRKKAAAAAGPAEVEPEPGSEAAGEWRRTGKAAMEPCSVHLPPTSTATCSVTTSIVERTRRPARPLFVAAPAQGRCLSAAAAAEELTQGGSKTEDTSYQETKSNSNTNSNTK